MEFWLWSKRISINKLRQWFERNLKILREWNIEIIIIANNLKIFCWCIGLTIKLFPASGIIDVLLGYVLMINFYWKFQDWLYLIKKDKKMKLNYLVFYLMVWRLRVIIHIKKKNLWKIKDIIKNASWVMYFTLVEVKINISQLKLSNFLD